MSGQCQVDFYVLQKRSQSPQELACHLALKAWEQGHKIAVMTEDDQAAARLDELMWEKPQGRFLPHALEASGDAAPVSIGTADGIGGGDAEVLINLTASAVSDPLRFKRLLEVVPAEESQRQASRLKFRQYREQGLEPAHHPIG